MDGFFHKPAGERQNCARHRGGKEHGLVGIAIECLEDSLHRGQKAQIQHLVGLIEHQDSHAIELQIATFVEIDQSARRADDDIDALVELFDLFLVGAAAVDGG